MERILRLLPITKPDDGQNVNNGTDGAATVDLRGLGEERNLVLIDGRFRPGCFLTALLKIERPITVLFDDYLDRPCYHGVEAFAKPVARASRMVRFELEPSQLDPAKLGLALDLFAEVK